jgi:hypothetical protein
MDLVMDEDGLQTLLIDVDNHRYWAKQLGTSPEILTAVFMSLPDAEEIKFVSMDLNVHRIRAVQKCLPNAVIEVNPYFVLQRLDWCMEKVRRAEAGKLLAMAFSDQPSALLPIDAPTRIAFEKCIRPSDEVDVMHRSGHLFDGHRGRLTANMRHTTEFLLGRLPLFSEVNELSQKIRQLYSCEVSPAVAKALLKQWLGELSDEALALIRPFAASVRDCMPNICVYWLR